jgi:hypothetical protein
MSSEGEGFMIQDPPRKGGNIAEIARRTSNDRKSVRKQLDELRKRGTRAAGARSRISRNPAGQRGARQYATS